MIILRILGYILLAISIILILGHIWPAPFKSIDFLGMIYSTVYSPLSWIDRYGILFYIFFPFVSFVLIVYSRTKKTYKDFAED